MKKETKELIWAVVIYLATLLAIFMVCYLGCLVALNNATVKIKDTKAQYYLEYNCGGPYGNLLMSTQFDQLRVMAILSSLGCNISTTKDGIKNN